MTVDTAAETIGQRIKRLRGDTGLTQRELSHVLGHPNHNRHSCRVANWEAGTSHPRIADLPRVAEVLHCSTDYLLSGGTSPQWS